MIFFGVILLQIVVADIRPAFCSGEKEEGRGKGAGVVQLVQLPVLLQPVKLFAQGR